MRLLLLGACLASAAVLALTIGDVRAAPRPKSVRPTMLTMRLEMAPEYVVGLPFFVEVTLANETEGTEYYDLAQLNPASPPFPVELSCTGGGKVVKLPARATRHDNGFSRHGERRRGFDLVPGEARTFVLDLSELERELKPGAWQCRARWVMDHETPVSKSAPVKLSAAPRADAALVARCVGPAGPGRRAGRTSSRHRRGSTPTRCEACRPRRIARSRRI